MGLKILHSADWHLDSPFRGFSDDQRAYLKKEQLTIPGKIADLCRREGCDLVLLSGDLFDGPYNRETAQVLYRELTRCGVPVFISPGNHDYVSPDSPWMAEPWPENVHIFKGDLTSVAVPGLDCRVWGAGYRNMDCPGVLQGFRAEGSERYQIAVFHGDPMQIRSPYCPITFSQVRDSGLSYLALGHIHKAGSFRAGRTLCGWPGTPMGRGFDETRAKGVYVVTLDKETTCRFVELDTPRFYQIEGEEAELRDSLPATGNNDFYRVTLTGSGEENFEYLCRKFPNMELIDNRESPQDLWQNVGEDTLEGVYFRLLKEKLDAADPDLAEEIRLAAEISRKLLDGRKVSLP